MPGALDIQYAYSATQNNSKLTSQIDVISGEQVTYTYDSLNRLATAVTTDNPNVTQWGQSYTYDGLGNLTDQNVIKGSAPTMHVAYNVATNRQTGDSADANGNLGLSYIYDIENRLLRPGTNGPQYAYDDGNERVWRGSSSPSLDEITYWSVDGSKLATYQVGVSGSTINFTLTGTDVYFGGLIAKGTFNSAGSNDKITLAPVRSDQLGSIGKFYPYGQERPSATTNDTEKFTGYYRDAATGLDYAYQRYHQPGVGRFMTPDPFGGSAAVGNPGSWNRYAYAGGDPINRVDPSGLDDSCDPSDPLCDPSCYFCCYFCDPGGQGGGCFLEVGCGSPGCVLCGPPTYYGPYGPPTGPTGGGPTGPPGGSPTGPPGGGPTGGGSPGGGPPGGSPTGPPGGGTTGPPGPPPPPPPSPPAPPACLLCTIFGTNSPTALPPGQPFGLPPWLPAYASPFADPNTAVTGSAGAFFPLCGFVPFCGGLLNAAVIPGSKTVCTGPSIGFGTPGKTRSVGTATPWNGAPIGPIMSGPSVTVSVQVFPSRGAQIIFSGSGTASGPTVGSIGVSVTGGYLWCRPHP